MSLTKIGSIGINTGIAFAGVTTIVTLNTANDALSIGATVNVGSGITLGASGDIFATGVSTFSGNLKVRSGVTISPDGDGFYTGVVTATSFVGDGANLTNVDVVSDTSPQLGGNLDVNTKNIVFGDSSDGSSDDVLSFGASGDLKIFHQSDQSRIVESGPSVLKIMGSDVRISNAGNTADYIQCNDGSDVKLYHNGNIKLETTSTGVTITNDLLLDGSANLGNYIRTNYDGGGHMYFKNNSQGANYSSHFQTYLSSDEGGTTQTHIHYYHGGYAELLHQGDSVLRTLADGVQFRDGGAVKGQFTDEGLCFGTDTATANALDDYEEGTWIARFYPNSSSFSSSSYDLDAARYTKIGNVVYWVFRIRISSFSGGGGNLEISGLPYTVATGQPMTSSHLHPSNWANNPPKNIIYKNGLTRMDLYYESGTSLFSVPLSALQNNAYLIGQGFYFI